MRVVDGRATFKLAANGGAEVLEILFSTNLVDWTVVRVITNAGSGLEFTDAPRTAPVGFYGVRVVVPVR
jgi:hypothetical protein